MSEVYPLHVRHKVLKTGMDIVGYLEGLAKCEKMLERSLNNMDAPHTNVYYVAISDISYVRGYLNSAKYYLEMQEKQSK